MNGHDGDQHRTRFLTYELTKMNRLIFFESTNMIEPKLYMN